MPDLDENMVVRRFADADTPESLAELLSDPTPEEARALALYLGEERFDRLRELALRVGAERGPDRDRGGVVVLPGIMGSELSVEAFGGNARLVWVNIRRILTGWLDTLALDPGGLNPADPDARYSVKATGLMNKYYAEIMLRLARDRNVRPFPYDWRRDIAKSAALLDGFIRSEFGGEPVSLVAHSMGGLVARTLLLGEPKASGGGALVEKLVLLGTPNRGSFEVPMIFAGIQDTVRQLTHLAYPLTSLTDSKAARRKILKILNTFPSVYQMMPAQGSSVDRLFAPATYHDVNPEISRMHLGAAREYQERLASGKSDNIFYVAGYGHDTVVGIRDWSRLDVFESYEVNRRGDGKVPLDLGPMGGTTYYATVEHAALADDPTVLEAVAELLAVGVTNMLPDREPVDRAAPVDRSEAWAKEMREREQEEAERLRSLAFALAPTRRGDGAGPEAPSGLPPEPPGAGTEIDPVEVEVADGLLGGLVGGPDSAGSLGSSGVGGVGPSPTGATDEPIKLRVKLVNKNIASRHLDPEVPGEPLIDSIAFGIYSGARAVWSVVRDLDLSIEGGSPPESPMEKVAGDEHGDANAAPPSRLLANLIQRGLIRGDLGVTTPLPDPRDQTGRRHLAIVGMGKVAGFGLPEVRLVSRELAWFLGRLRKKHLATILIGAGKGNLPPADAMGEFLKGLAVSLVDAVSLKLADSRLAQVTFAEFYPGRMRELNDVIIKAQEDLLEAFNVKLDYTPIDPEVLRRYDEEQVEVDCAEVRKKAENRARSGEGDTSSRGSGFSRVTAELVNDTYWFGAITPDAAIPERPVEVDPRLIEDANTAIVAARDEADQWEAGLALGRLVVPQEFRGVFSPGAPLVMEVNPATARIHWELVVQPNPMAGDGQTGDAEALALSRGFTRQLRTRFAPLPEATPSPRRRLRVLVVADPAPGPGRLRGAEREGMDVAQLFETFNHLAPEGSGAVVTRLFGPAATRYNVMRRLLTTEFDVLHYAGHAFFKPDYPPASGWMFRFGGGKQDAEVLSSRELRRIDHVPPFVFSNACESGITPNRPEGRSGDFAPSFAEAFFDRGVANFVCTAWPVGDQAARKFARVLYSKLLGLVLDDQGDTFRGKTDRPCCMYEAMRAAREKVFKHPTGLRTWGAYQHYGNPFSRFFPANFWPTRAESARGLAEGNPGPGTGQGGGAGSGTATGHVPPGPEPGPGASGGSADPFANIRRLIEAHRTELLAIPRVIDVRPGFKYTGGWTTGRRAVVVVVEEKIKPPAAVPAGQLIPESLGGVLTDVTPATPSEQFRRGDTRAPEVQTVSPFDDLVAPGVSPEVVPDDEAVERALAQYQPPEGVLLEPVQDEMIVTCHMSPDVGWPVLSSFLGEVEQSLTVAMYDFSAPHILKRLQQRLCGIPRTLKLVLDPALSLTNGGGPGNPKEDDIDEDTVVEQLRRTLGRDRFQFTWAAVKRKGKVSQGIFPKAYHIKVAVRDDEAFWLSSGNWQSSNQPPLDVVPEDTGAGIDRPSIWTKYNREWHVVVAHPGLARTLHAYIDSDFEQAELHQAEEPGEASEAPQAWLLVPIDEGEEERRPREVQRFEPLTVSRPVKVVPVLTPDNYAEHILPLIEGATSTLYFQNQYIAIAKQIPKAFSDLIDALLDRARVLGDGFRMILRDIGDARPMLDVLEGLGFDVATQVKLQKAAHTKGIVVDRRRVLVGSHNWSGPGTTRNRDASLLFDDEEIAGYYARTFLHDWTNLAATRVSGETLMPRVVADGSRSSPSPPAGFVSVPWESYYED